MSSIQRPKQTQILPGEEKLMNPRSQSEDPGYQGSNKLKVRCSYYYRGGIGRAVTVAFAKQGADVVVFYLNEEDAQETV